MLFTNIQKENNEWKMNAIVAQKYTNLFAK